MERLVRLQVIFLALLSLVAIGGVLHITQQVVLPLVIAALLSFILAPLVVRMHRARIPYFLGITVVMLLLVLIIAGLGTLLSSSLYSLIREYPRYQTRFIGLYNTLVDRFHLREWLFNDLSWVRTIGSYLVGLSGRLVELVSYTVLVLLFLLFLLLEWRHLPRKMLRALRRGLTARIARILEHISEQISRYLAVKFLISLATGLLVWAAYSLIGLDFAFIWGLLAFLFNFIPNIGSAVVWGLSSLFAVIQFYPDWQHPLLVSGSMILIQMVMGNLLEPKLAGEQLNLSPVVVLFSLLFWGWLWGVAGMFIAVPLTVIVKIVCENIPQLKAVSILMGTASRRDRSRDGRA
ncbi:protein of unknown function UPF0118 [Spirochaeta thermophila DSM 6578]|uniref:AI-2E family transporter n=1 Tax=Winmispira thermophila (strain ATCC 700085 / DSM 6578 / Z-1203) TaxID=869211 RepID=G0GB53_WINT7|nr:AI-2E family transporter [Spirochaeta thermophila]AEJ61077.1 protein of unknown function UPF0118 [Spirochaeta thermophila DSM 6578]